MERNQEATKNTLPQKSSTPGEGTPIGIRHNVQDQEPILTSNPGIDIVRLPQPTEKRGRGRPRGSGRETVLSQGSGRRGRGRPPGKARLALLEAQLASVDPSGKRQEHPSDTLQHNPSEDQDMAIESEKPQASAISLKSNSDGQRQRARADSPPHGVVFDEQSLLEDDLSFNFPVLTRSKRVGLRFTVEIDHKSRRWFSQTHH